MSTIFGSRTTAAKFVSVERHPALTRTWWTNLYTEGQATLRMCESEQDAKARCLVEGGAQVEVKLVLVKKGKT